MAPWHWPTHMGILEQQEQEFEPTIMGSMVNSDPRRPHFVPEGDPTDLKIRGHRVELKPPVPHPSHSPCRGALKAFGRGPKAFNVDAPDLGSCMVLTIWETKLILQSLDGKSGLEIYVYIYILYMSSFESI